MQKIAKKLAACISSSRNCEITIPFNDCKARQAAKDETKQRNFDKCAHSMSFDRESFLHISSILTSISNSIKVNGRLLKSPPQQGKTTLRKIKEPWLPFN